MDSSQGKWARIVRPLLGGAFELSGSINAKAWCLLLIRSTCEISIFFRQLLMLVSHEVEIS